MTCIKMNIVLIFVPFFFFFFFFFFFLVIHITYEMNFVKLLFQKKKLIIERLIGTIPS